MNILLSKNLYQLVAKAEFDPFSLLMVWRKRKVKLKGAQFRILLRSGKWSRGMPRPGASEEERLGTILALALLLYLCPGVFRAVI